MSTKIKMIVFDIAGTTVADDNTVAEAFQKAFGSVGMRISKEEINPLMGYKKPTAIQIVLERNGVEHDENMIDEIHDDFVNEMLGYYKYTPVVKPLPAAEEIFEWLKEKGIRIVLNTGFSKEIADMIVNRLQWKEKKLIDDYIASDEVEEGRPHPGMIQALMRRAGLIDTREVAKVGDTEVDILEGRNAVCGMVVAVTTGAYTREQLSSFHPDHILDSLAELPGIIS